MTTTALGPRFRPKPLGDTDAGDAWHTPTKLAAGPWVTGPWACGSNPTPVNCGGK